MKILVVEDDIPVAEILVHAMVKNHWIVEHAIDGALGLALAKSQTYDLIILDINLPKINGIDICKQLRNDNCAIPILLLTAENSINSQIKGLNSGANDYVIKPFNIDLVCAKARSLVRKEKASNPILTWENIQIDSNRNEVFCHGKRINLRAKEFNLLELFLLNPRRIYSRRSILDLLWNSASESGEETVSTHIKCLRKKLKEAGVSNPIETVYGLGYRLRIPSTHPASPQTHNQHDQKPVVIHRQEQASNSVNDYYLPHHLDSLHPIDSIKLKTWNKFKSKYFEQIEFLENHVNVFYSKLDLELKRECQRIAHKLIGSMGMFGFLEVSQLARQLEELIQLENLQESNLVHAIQIVQDLKKIIIQEAIPLDNQKTSFDKISPHQKISTILVIDDDVSLTENLQLMANQWNFEIKIAHNLCAAKQKLIECNPDLILLDLNFPDEESGLNFIRDMDPKFKTIPIFVLTAQGDLPTRVAVVNLGIQTFLDKSSSIEDIFKTISSILDYRPMPNSFRRLLIVDDDSDILQELADSLSNSNLMIKVSSDLSRFSQILDQFHPDILILDLEMPDFNGIEICKAIRADPKWSSLTIIVLSAHTEVTWITQSYAAGANNYIDKSNSILEIQKKILNGINCGFRSYSSSHTGISQN